MRQPHRSFLVTTRFGEKRKRTIFDHGDAISQLSFARISREYTYKRNKRIDCQNRWLFSVAILVASSFLIFDQVDKDSLIAYPRDMETMDAVDSTTLVIQNNTIPITITTKSSAVPTGKARWNATQLLQVFKEHSMTNKSAYTWKDLLDLAPKPKGNDVEIYNVDAWKRLRALLGIEQQEQGQRKSSRQISSLSSSKVTLCSMGGSATAGAGDMDGLERWDVTFAKMLKVSQPSLNLHVVNRGHGWRGSIHSAMLLQSLVPRETDILIWEFAMNDCHPKGCDVINTALQFWLDQVTLQFSPPPLVLLAYLWNVDGSTHTISSLVYQCHHRLAAKYDFVVGSVNLHSYLDQGNDPTWDVNVIPKYILIDPSHPGGWGHQLLGFLLWDLVTDDTRTIEERGGDDGPSLKSGGDAFHCESNSPAKKKILSTLTSKPVLASWTSELPRNENVTVGMMEPKLWTVHSQQQVDKEDGSSNMTYILHGKASHARQDRKLALVLPCCDSRVRFGFNLPSFPNGTTHTLKESRPISAMLLHSPEAVKMVNERGAVKFDKGLVARKIQVEVWDDEETNITTPLVFQSSRQVHANTTSLGGGKQQLVAEWVTFDSNDCLLGDFSVNPWLVLPNDMLLSRIAICNMDPNCGNPDNDPISLMHVVLI